MHIAEPLVPVLDLSEALRPALTLNGKTESVDQMLSIGNNALDLHERVNNRPAMWQRMVCTP